MKANSNPLPPVQSLIAPDHEEQDLAGIDLALVALERSVLFDSLLDYSIALWPQVTGVPLRRNHAIDGMIEVLQAVATGQLDRNRCLIEIGPGLGKSTELTIYQSWRIAREAAHRAIRGSHSFDLASRDSRRVRRICTSEWWQARFAARLRADENTVSRWSTIQGADFIAVGVGGSLTGHRCNEVVVDDALNVMDAHSKAARDACYVWATEALLTRIDGDGPAIVCGQRLGTDDLAGRLREMKTWTVITLPAEYDPRRSCVVFGIDGTEVWRDHRTEEHELAAPDTLSREKLDEMRAAIGSSAFESQYNQNPSSDETSMVPARWWRWYRAPGELAGTRRPHGCDDGPAIVLPPITQTIIGADLTFGSEKGDHAVVQVWGVSGGQRFLLRQWRQRAGFDQQLAAIEAFATEFPGSTIVVEQAANGKAVIEQLRKRHPGVLACKPVGGKAQRLASVVSQIESGSCFIPEHANYTADFVDEFRTFPGRHDDMVDCAVWCLLQTTKHAGRVMPQGGTRGTEHTFIAAPIAAPTSSAPNIYAAIGGSSGSPGPRSAFSHADYDFDRKRR